MIILFQAFLAFCYVSLAQQIEVNNRIFPLPEETTTPTNDRPIFRELVNKAAETSNSVSTPSITTYPVYENLHTVIVPLGTNRTSTAVVDDDFMKIVLFRMMSLSSGLFDDDYLSSLDPDKYSVLSSSLSSYNNLSFPDQIVESELASSYASLFDKIKTNEQSSLLLNISSFYVAQDGMRTSNSWYISGFGLYNFTTVTIYDSEVPDLPTTGSLSVYAELYSLAQCHGIDYDINNCCGHSYNTLATAGSNTNTSYYDEFITVYSSWQDSIFNTDSISFELCKSMIEFVDVLPWSDRIHAEANIAFSTMSEKFLTPFTITNSTTLSPPVSITSLDQLTQVTFSAGPVSETASVEEDFLKIVIFRMITFSSEYFNENYLSSLDSENNVNLSGPLTSYLKLPFPDQSVESSLAQGYASMFSKISSSEMVTLIPQLSTMYATQDSFRTLGSWYNNNLGIWNFSTSTSPYDTYLPESTYSGDYMIFSDLFVLAQCVALDYDIRKVNGHDYNVFATSNTNTTAFDSFKNIYSEWTSLAFVNTSSSLEMCTSIAQYVSLFSWSDRINAAAKIVFKKQTDYLVNPTYVGGATLSMPPPPTNSAISLLVEVTGECTPSHVYPFEVVYTGSVSGQNASRLTHTTTVSKETMLITTGTITNIIHTKQVITSNNAEMALCGAVAYIFQFSNDPNLVYFIGNNTDKPIVQSYSSILEKYRTEDVMTNSTQIREVMLSFYNLVFIFPDDLKQRLVDVMGYCVLKRQTSGILGFKIKDYKTGDGQLFSSLFKFGNGTTYIDYNSVYTEYATNSDYEAVTTISSTYPFQATLVQTKAPLLVKSILSGTQDGTADAADLAKGAIDFFSF